MTSGQDVHRFEQADVCEGQRSISRGRGRPRSAATKQLVSLRLDADVLESFRGTGDGWQTRINNVLREWLDRSGKSAGT